MSQSFNRALFLSAALLPAIAGATNGYFMGGTGTKNQGMAGAGSADPEEAMIMATDPAGLAFISPRIELGIGLFSPDRSYSSSSSLAKGQGGAFTIGPNDITSDNKLFPMPSVGAVWAMADDSRIGVAFYGRGGMNTEWAGGTATFDPDGPGPAPVMSLPGTYGGGTAGVDLMQAFLNVTWAKTFADGRAAFGASLIGAAQRFEAIGVGTFAGYTKSFAASGGTAMPKSLSNNGHDMSVGVGGALGLHWAMTDNFAVAASYSSKVSMGRFDKYADLFAEGGKFDIPSSITVGFSIKASDNVVLNADVQRINYTDVASVSNPISNLFGCPTAGAGGTDLDSCLGGSRGAGFGWEDMDVYKLGIRWNVNSDLTLRAGFSHGKQPIASSQVTFNILAPGVTEDHIAAGFTRRSGNGEWSGSLTYAPSQTVKGANTFDPTQQISLSMDQWMLQFSYSWLR
jgi:long-chain fatty acid transport protein